MHVAAASGVAHCGWERNAAHAPIRGRRSDERSLTGVSWGPHAEGIRCLCPPGAGLSRWHARAAPHLDAPQPVSGGALLPAPTVYTVNRATPLSEAV